MQFLKTLFWMAVAVALALFAYANRRTVTIELWGGLEADIKLPVLFFGAFRVVFVPTFVLYRARVWSLRRRLEASERNAMAAHASTAGLAETGATENPPVPPATTSSMP